MRTFLLAAALSGALAAPALADDPLKIGFVYVGPIGDHGWSYQHHEGLLAVEEAFGEQVETTYVESVSEGPDAERVIRQLAASGHGLIFTTSFGYMDPTVKIARMFPDVMFEHATGFKRSDNVATYSGRFYEGRYVIGRIAGHLSQTGEATYIGSFPIPEVIRGVNAFTLGMRSVNPDAQVNVIWVNSWYDPGKEADAARAAIAQGSDIITQHTDSPAPLQAAANEGVKAFGQASDMRAFGPEAQLTAIVDDWAPYYIARVQAALDGSWESADTWGGLGSGMVVMADYANMPEDVAADAAATETAIASGDLAIFAGSINDQNGAERVAEGETLADGDLLGMMWFVEGVNGALPR